MKKKRRLPSHLLLLRSISGAPSRLLALVPAWGSGLHGATAGEEARLYVRLRPEGRCLPGSAAGRKLLHAITVEAFETTTHEAATVSTRQVVLDGPSSALGADPPDAFLAGGGEVAEDAPMPEDTPEWLLEADEMRKQQ